MKKFFLTMKNNKEERNKIIVGFVSLCAVVATVGVFLWNYFTPEPNPNECEEEDEEGND